MARAALPVNGQRVKLRCLLANTKPREAAIARSKSQRSLMNWTKQKWRTKSGKPSTQGPKATGERYLPSAAIKAMSSSQYAASSAKKRKDKRAGKQFSKQPKAAAQISKRYR